MIINHQYKINFTPITYHIYEKYEPNIGTIEYKDRIEPQLQIIWNELNKKPNSRHAVITLNNFSFMSCLLSYQAQIHKEQLFITISMRSQAQEYVEKDSNMYLYWTTIILKNLHYKIKNVDITCFVGNYHSRHEI